MVLKITVKTLDSQNYNFEAEDSWTVQQFKDHIQPTVDTSANEQRLIFCGRVLQDDKKLTDYDCNGKVIHLVRRPPPPLDAPSSGSGSAADSNNNSSTGATDGSGSGAGGENVRFLDDNNVLFSALTLGPDANMNHILRHILSVQEAIYTRNSNTGSPATGSTMEPLSMTEVERHLHNAARLLRITVNTINECMSRIAALPPTGPRRQPSSSTSSTSNERSSLDSTRVLISTASSDTDLQRDVEMQTNDTNQSAPSASVAATAATPTSLSSTVDDISVNASDDDTPRRTERPEVPRQSLTTDDLPQFVRRTMPQLPPPSATRSQYERRGIGENVISRRRSRHESELDRYMTILYHSGDIQNQFQGLVRRYRHFVDISRRGGLIVPRASTSSRDSNSTTTDSSTSTSDNQSEARQPLSFTFREESRILGMYIPRIMHHISHLQHALSAFTVDFTRGRLSICQGTARRTGVPSPREMRRSNSSSQSPQAQQAPPSAQMSRSAEQGTTAQVQQDLSSGAPRPNQTLEGSVTITATAIETTPILTSTPTSNLRPQANATIVVTSEPLQTGAIRIPVSMSMPHGSISVDFTSPVNRGPPTQVPPQDGQPNSGQQQNQQARPSTQANQTSNSTQTVNRPIGVISGRIPLPFDYYLPCFSPWANYSHAYTNRARPNDVPTARIHIRRQQANPTAQFDSANQNASQNNTGPTVNVTTQGPRTQSAAPTLDIGLSEVVTNLVGSIFRQPSTSQNATQGANSNSTNNQDPFLSMIPELALSTASQILSGVFGVQNTPPINIPPSTSNNQQTSGRSAQMATSSGTVMMDIDIDDSSSSQSESRYQDAQETQSPVPPSASILTNQPNLPTTQSAAPIRQSSIPITRPATSSSQPGQSQGSNTELKYDRQQLVEVMQNHPDWIPIIEADIGVLEQQQRANSNNQPFFSDAYLSSIPRKRRRLLTASPERVLILQPSPSQAISNLLRRAITNSSSSNIASIDQLLNNISNDEDLQSAYEDYIKSAVEARLRSDYDYCPEKFANSSKYFK